MNSRLTIAIAVLAVVGAMAGFYIYREYNRTNVEIDNLEVSAKVTSDQVYTVFSTDTAKARRDYLDKVLEVSGTVESAEAISDTISQIVLAAQGSMAGGVQASIKAGQDASKATVGANVRLKCRCKGIDDLFGSVVMMDCLIL